MDEKTRQDYLKAYYQNEYDANRHMSFALAFTAILLLIIWILYFTPLFDVTAATKQLTIIVLPIVIALLIEPMFFLKTKHLRHSGYKYYLLSVFILSMAVLNVIISKHGVMGWAICIVLTNHYYNLKFGRIIFAVTLFAMFLCLFLAMFFGEYDPYLLMGELDEPTNTIHTYHDTSITFLDTPSGRYEYLVYLKNIGYNRFVSVFVYYYLARAVVATIIFFVSNSLNKRTYKLLVDEIKVGSNFAAQSKDLEIAGEIQLSVLPESFESNKDYEIIANLDPTREVGGDFYDYYKLDNDHVAILIGDVSGKGSPAAMFMMKTITCFKNFVSLEKTPSQIIKEVNKAIFAGNKNEMFVTCFFGILDLKTGLFRFANAGHNPPIIGHPLNYHYLKCSNGFVLGGMEQAFVKDEEIIFEKGDSITLYTDGVTEARNQIGEFYNEKRLLELFNRREYESIVELHYDLINEISSFTKGAEQSDDITYLALLYKGGVAKNNELKVTAKIENLNDIFKLVDKVLMENKAESLKERVRSVVNDIYKNIVKCAYQDSEGDIYFRINYLENKDMISLTFIDKGFEFNQLDATEELNSMNNVVNGFNNIKKYTDEASYLRLNGKNVLNVKFKVN